MSHRGLKGFVCNHSAAQRWKPDSLRHCAFKIKSISTLFNLGAPSFRKSSEVRHFLFLFMITSPSAQLCIILPHYFHEGLYFMQVVSL